MSTLPRFADPTSVHSYPEKIRQHLHRTLAYVPQDIALALEDSPDLISEAVAAFYERDPAGLKVRSDPRIRLLSSQTVMADRASYDDRHVIE